MVDKLLKHRKRGREYQFLIILKGTPTHDAELRTSRDFIDTDITITGEFLNYIKKNNISKRLDDNDVVEVDNSREAGKV